MDRYPSRSWGSRLVRAVLLLLGVAIAARVIYELLAPLLPLAIALLVVGALYVMLVGRGRR